MPDPVGPAAGRLALGRLPGRLQDGLGRARESSSRSRACSTTLFFTLSLARRLDYAWRLVRRAAGYEQKKGALEWIFVISLAIAGTRVHDLVLHHPGPRLVRLLWPDRVAPPALGLLDYYRQFDDMDQEEVNQRLREKRRREKEMELQVVPNLDLSSTEWPDFPNSEVMNAAIFVARGRVNGYPDRFASGIRAALAERHGVDPGADRVRERRDRAASGGRAPAARRPATSWSRTGRRIPSSR